MSDAALPPDRLGDPLPAGLPPGVSRLRSRRSSSALAAALRRDGWNVGRVDLAGASTRSDVLRAFSVALAFPTWVGHTWDALDDALRDLSWWPPGPRGRVIIVRGADGLARTSPQEHGVVLDILVTAAARWGATEAPLTVLLRR